MCGDGVTKSVRLIDTNCIASAKTTGEVRSTASAEGGGDWQGGDYQALLERQGQLSCDSSLGAWSEDGHRSHIEEKKKMSRTVELQKRKRSSAIVNGTLFHQTNFVDCKSAGRTTAAALSSATSSPASALATHTQSHCVHSPAQISDTYSSPFASPLCKFPTIPARCTAGGLLAVTLQPSTFTTRSTAQLGSLCGRRSPLTRQVSQTRVDDSPLDTPSVLAAGWTVEPAKQGRGQRQGQDEDSIESTTALIDDFIINVKQGLLGGDLVGSPDELKHDGREEDEKSSQGGWETEECDITPRLRPVWREQEDGSSAEGKGSGGLELSGAQSHRDSIASVKASNADRRPSFIRVPSAIFPHTPAKRRSFTAKRSSGSSLSSRSSRSSKRSSGGSLHRCSSEYVAAPPRPLARKSRYYSRTTVKPGGVAPIKQQHLQGARGKFWSPMNSVYLASGEAVASRSGTARQSTRYSRRSGHDWVRPRTFEVKNQYRVTIYPPRPDEFFEQGKLSQAKGGEIGTKGDPDKTPTQAEFLTALTAATKRPGTANSTKSSKSTLTRTLPPCPAPTRSLPPVPVLGYATKSGKVSMKREGARASLSQRSSSCSQCPRGHSSPSCSCSLTSSLVSSSASYHSEAESCVQACSCGSDAGTYTHNTTTTSSYSKTDSDRESCLTPRVYGHSYQRMAYHSKASQMLGIPLDPPPPIRSAPLSNSLSRTEASIYTMSPHSAPYCSSQFPPVLEPLPRMSPFRIDFGSVFGFKRRSKVGRSSTATYLFTCLSSSSYSETTYTGVSQSTGAYLTAEGTSTTGSLTAAETGYTPTDSDSYDSMSKSASSRSSGYDSSEETDSDEVPLTPPRSEYQSSFAESPGYRMSFIVSPIAQSAKRFSQLQHLLDSSPPLVGPLQQQHRVQIVESSLVPRPSPSPTSVSQFTSVSSSSHWTYSPNGKHRVPRSILKTSKYCHYDGVDRRPAVAKSMAANRFLKSDSSFPLRTNSLSKPSAPQRATLATSTLTKMDLEGRIVREENRRKRNESRLNALEKLEGKTKKSSLFFSLLSNSSNSAGGGGGKGGKGREWEEEEDASPLPQTPLTPTKEHLLEMQHQFERRQRISQFQNNKAVSFTDVIGFDMGTYPKVPLRKIRKGNGSSGQEDEQDATVLKLQLKKLSTAIEARQYAKDKCIDK